MSHLNHDGGENVEHRKAEHHCERFGSSRNNFGEVEKRQRQNSQVGDENDEREREQRNEVEAAKVHAVWCCECVETQNGQSDCCAESGYRHQELPPQFLNQKRAQERTNDLNRADDYRRNVWRQTWSGLLENRCCKVHHREASAKLVQCHETNAINDCFPWMTR